MGRPDVDEELASEGVWRIVHAFSDRERKDSVRALARRVERLESI